MIDYNKLRVGCIGCGIMGGALIKAVCKVINPANVIVSDADKKKAAVFAAETGCKTLESNEEVAESADFVFLAVKPQYLNSVLTELRKHSENYKNTVFISIAAGVPIEVIKSGLNNPSAKVVRLMPNLPALAGEALIALCAANEVSGEEKTAVTELLKNAGGVIQTEERLMNAFTAISGSGPAYAFLFLEALADAAVKFGIPRQQALLCAGQTLKGAAELMLQTGKHPAVLKDEVCSPAGTTIEAVQALERSGFRSAVIDAADAAYNKALSLDSASDK